MKPKILFNITYKFKENRIHLVRDVLNNILSYNDYDIKIIMDTDIDCSILFSDFDIQYNVCKNLQHPFHLIYQHRNNFLQNINNFDYFFHMEDDIVFPEENFNEAIDNFHHLWENGYIQSFTTVENYQNKLMSVQITEDCKIQLNRLIYSYNNKNFAHFIHLNHHYSAMWFIPKLYLIELLKIPKINTLYKTVNESREEASSFIRLIGKMPVTLLNGNKINTKSYCYHITCNYSPNQNIPYGKVCVEDIHVSN